MASVVKKTQATKPSKKTSVKEKAATKEKVSSKPRVPKEKALKKKAREAAEADFNFSDAFDQAERDSKLTAVEVSERVELNTVIHSGSLVMDLVVYGGGLQAGRIYDLHGPESGGKTTLGNIILVQAIKSIPGPVGKTKGYYIDAEGTLDREWFRNIAKSYGVDLSLKEIFGKKDENGAWLYKPTIRLLKPTVGDVLLKTLVRVLNAMPDKVFMQDHWMYSWTPVEAKVAKKTGGLTDKQLRAMLESKGIAWDKDLFNKSGSFMAPIPNNYGGPELVVLIDSMIALTPRQTAEDDSAAMAQHGRMFSKWINAIKSLAAAKGVTFININQLRKNPSVMFGCFEAKTPVLMGDGHSERIYKLVQEDAAGKVLSYNTKSGIFEPKRILRTYNNGHSVKGEFLELTCDLQGSNNIGKVRLLVTKAHRILTPNGFIQAGNLKRGDLVVHRVPSTYNLSKDQKQVLYGSLIGDGCIFYGDHFFRVHYKHVDYQKNYLQWKVRLLHGEVTDNPHKYTTKKGEDHQMFSGYSGELPLSLVPETLQKVRKKRQRFLPLSFIKKLDQRAISVWFMDDGHFSSVNLSRDGWSASIACSRFGLKTRQRLAKKVSELFGVEVKVNSRGISIARKANVVKFLSQLAKYMHPDFRYKMGPVMDTVSDYGSYIWKKSKKTSCTDTCKILSIKRTEYEREKFDLKVQDTKTYVVGGQNGVIVHNSPDYAPGGEAIKYVADCRNIVSPCANPSGGGQIEEDGKDVYRWTSFTNKKNKLSAPGTKIKFRWWTQRDGKTGCGLDPVHDTLEYLELTGQLVEKGRKGFYVILAGHEKAKSVLDTYMFNTQSFKEFVVSGIFSDGDYKARCDIRKICREQIKSGLAFTLYRGSSKAKKSEVIDEDDED